MTSSRQHRSILRGTVLLLPLLLFSLLDNASVQQPFSEYAAQSSAELDGGAIDAVDLDTALFPFHALVLQQAVAAKLAPVRTVFVVAATWSAHKPARAPPYLWSIRKNPSFT